MTNSRDLPSKEENQPTSRTNLEHRAQNAEQLPSVVAVNYGLFFLYPLVDKKGSLNFDLRWLEKSTA